MNNKLHNKPVFPFSVEQIKNLSSNSIKELIELDKNGLLIGYQENFNEYQARLLSIISDLYELSSELEVNTSVKISSNIKLSQTDLIPMHIKNNASATTKSLYKFKCNWVLGFFLSKGIGQLAGACALTSKNGFTLFLLRKIFSQKENWLWYSRDELLSHELCHVARAPINDISNEEFFAYKISKSPFRRYVGNCFQKPIDTILFLIPFFLLLIMQIISSFFLINIPMMFFWILAFIFPILFIIRNQYYRCIYFNAEKKLASFGIDKSNIKPLLFRSHQKEIKEITKLNTLENFNNWLKTKISKEIRWEIINKRFINI